MEDEKLLAKLECLKIAAQMPHVSIVTELIANAEKLYEFVSS